MSGVVKGLSEEVTFILRPEGRRKIIMKKLCRWWGEGYCLGKGPEAGKDNNDRG